jgi:hypothetical protein
MTRLVGGAAGGAPWQDAPAPARIDPDDARDLVRADRALRNEDTLRTPRRWERIGGVELDLGPVHPEGDEDTPEATLP